MCAFYLDQFLIQWVNNEVEIVCTDSWPILGCEWIHGRCPFAWGHDDMICLFGRDLAGFESLEEALFPFL
jgi:hypothetical protein